MDFADFAVLSWPERRFGKILKRSSIINILLAVAIGLAGLKTYEIWQQDDWSPIKIREKKPPVNGRTLGGGQVQGQPASTKIIVEKNLFDVDRGSGGSGRTATGPKNGSKIEGLVLLGTIVTDGEQFAIVKVPAAAGVGGRRRRAGSGETMKRLALGDTVWGYVLTEIQAERVFFKKGSSEVELALDFTRHKIRVKPSGKSKPSRKTRRQRATRKKK